MKRFGNLYEKIISINNLIAADQKARKGKLRQLGVKIFDKNKDDNILQLHQVLKDKTYKTSPYVTFIVYEPKERTVYRLPYFPDRITHHAIMNVMEPIFVSTFTKDTYSCIKNRGIHAASFTLRKYLQDIANTTYCLKLDIRKFYPNIDHQILKQLIRKKIKDNNLLWLLDEIIESAPGAPIGNYLSQYFANFYLTYFDHWIKEAMGVKYYLRYADDIIILYHDKKYLHKLLFEIKDYLQENLKLFIKDNYQVFPIKNRGIDFVGYVHYHDHVLLRKSIKKRFAKAIFKKKDKSSIDSYIGWTRHANCKNLVKKLMLK